MPRTAVVVPTPDGACPATLHTPAGDGPWPGVILYPDAAGVRETFAVLADRLAGPGYAVLLPDVYYRTPYTPFDPATVFADPAERARLEALVKSVGADLADRDAGAFLDFLAAHPDVSGTGVGVTGYCMGGRLALRAAGRHPGRVAAAASFHGGNLAAEGDPDSPHLLAGRMRAAIHVAAAEADRSFPPDQHERLRRALTEAGVRHTLETYPAAHGFAVPDVPTYDADADRRHREALAALWATALHA
ncbi:dienelactone hydrolase family protein [Actinomadura sp. ATCC 31491]|uniref:Dienelactone hydrolase family protein n=1 Tax=Actinomadura luzonensis TaxID=2805427 RepID=A0ABT0FNI5_9ACTN|nr:dienelactone hydrolase family protein [Actinomadura luzonensis]MCK2213911.1 dienelactone hydrolase family protein [Actinomadura luzonensis]